jgi:hypothetical protein
MCACFLGKKLSSRIKRNADIVAAEYVNQELIMDRIHPLHHATHQANFATRLGWPSLIVSYPNRWLLSRI